MTTLRSLTCQRSNHVVRFKPLGLEDRNAKDVEGTANIRKLARKILGHGLTLGLIALVAHIFKTLCLRVPFAQHADRARSLIAKDRTAHVEHSRKILGREILPQFCDHVHEDICGRGGESRPRGHGPTALHGVIRAEDEPHGIEQENGWLGLVRHATEFSRMRPSARSTANPPCPSHKSTLDKVAPAEVILEQVYECARMPSFLYKWSLRP